nr:hypothetical protein [Tanacetum cinerariifolium]
MVETHTPKKQKKRVQEQINIQVEEIANIHAEEELQQMIAGLDRSNEIIAKHLEEYDQAAAELTIREMIELFSELVKYQDHHSKILRNNLGWKVKDFKGMSFEEVDVKFKTIWEQIKGGVSKIPKGEAAWLKRKGIRSEQESTKKQKTTEEVPKEVKSYDEIPGEKIKELIRVVLIEEVYVEALQIDRDDLNQLWSLVKETLSIRPATDEKEMELWVELKRLFEPDVEDHLWTHTQHIKHAPVEWRLYDTCEVHHMDVAGKYGKKKKGKKNKGLLRASKINNIEGKVMGKDGNPLRRAVHGVHGVNDYDKGYSNEKMNIGSSSNKNNESVNDTFVSNPVTLTSTNDAPTNTSHAHDVIRPEMVNPSVNLGFGKEDEFWSSSKSPIRSV